MQSVKIGILGAGAISRNHIKGCTSHKQAEVVAICDQSRERAKEVADEFDLKTVYTDAKELFADPNIDAVSIALPNFLHRDMAVAALSAGKHVSLDKPFALNAAEAREVVDTAEKHGKVFMLGMNWRFNPDSQIARALVARGDIGHVYHAKCCWRRRSGSPRFGTWFTQKELAGGGALLDIGVHFLDLCLYVMDNFEPVAVSGAAYTNFGNRGIGEGGWGHSDTTETGFDVDDFGTGLIKFANGATAALDASWVMHQEEKQVVQCQAFGTEGGVAAHGPVKLFRFAQAAGEYEVVTPQDVKLRFPKCNRFCNWLDVILGEDELGVKPHEALAVQRILDGIYESSRSGREVRLDQD